MRDQPWGTRQDLLKLCDELGYMAARLGGTWEVLDTFPDHDKPVLVRTITRVVPMDEAIDGDIAAVRSPPTLVD